MAIGVSGSGYRGYFGGNGLLAAGVLDKIAGEAASGEVVPRGRLWPALFLAEGFGKERCR